MPAAARAVFAADKLPLYAPEDFGMLGPVIEKQAEGRSDHAPFWLAGESAVFFTDTANFRNKNYHTRQDTPDTLNRPFLTGAAKAAAATGGEASSVK